MGLSRVTCVVFVLAFSGCQSAAPTVGAEAFIPGDENDPVLQFALATAANTAVKITITNKSTYAWTQGLITLTPTYDVGVVASTALNKYVAQTSATAGNAATLAAALGLVVGTNAWIVPALAVNGSATITVPSASDAKLTFIARVNASADDFVGFRNAAIGASPSISGYDLNDSGGKVTLGNGTTGSSAGATPAAITNTNPCSVPAMTTASTVINKDMSTTAPNAPAWPGNGGDGGDFDGDWTTNGSVATVWVPGVTKPKVTGLFWFANICPLPGATLRASVDMDTRPFTQHASVTTLVVYFFDAAGVAVGIVEGWPLHRPNLRGEVMAEMAIPEQARRIALAPMAMISAGETNSPTFDNVRADYAPAAAVRTSVATDDFSVAGPLSQPLGWTEVGGDWVLNAAFNHAALWNPSWTSGSSATTSKLSKTFPLTATGNVSAELFVAATFSDAASFVRMDLTFSGGSTVQGETLYGSNYNLLKHTNVAIPVGTTSVTVTVNGTLGGSETSSLYVDSLKVSAQ